ncbi:hypothetical protein HKCCSP123_15595 [Rhodobacterales bacterium HKCCSP123]|nr:hypothetical protein [Rhodobacterales bacterium HKCCSP123]
MIRAITSFLNDQAGAVSVDWTTLSAAAVGMSLATAAMLTDSLQMVVSRVDGELRAQQMNDGFIQFTSAHFEPLYENNLLAPDRAESMFSTANGLMNLEILSALEEGIAALEAGQLTTDEIAALVAIASVAWQRNIVPDHVLDYYFGFDGNPSPRIGDAL